jgi:outer membrane protein
MIVNNKIIILIAVFGFYYATAQDYKDLTLDECLKIGLKNNKTLMIARQKIDFSEYKVQETDAQGLPALKFFGGYTRLSEVEPFTIQGMTISPSVYNQYIMRLTLQQQLFTGGRIENTGDMLELQLDAAKSDMEKDLKQVSYDIKNAFWNYYKSTEMKKSVDESITQLKAHIADVESFYRNGLATLNDVLKVKVQLSNLEITKIDAENGVEMANAGLNSAMGIDVTKRYTIKTDPEIQDSRFTGLSAAIDTAFRNRSELKSMNLRVEAGKETVEMSKSGWYPQVNFAANYNYNRPNSRIFPTKDEFRGTWDIGLTVTYDIWNWNTTSLQVQQAEANLEQSNLGIQQMKDGISLEVTQAFLTLSRAKEKIAVSEIAVKQAEENLRVTNERFRAGSLINSDLLDAETALLVSKINYTSAITDYRLSLVKLEKAAGY